MTSTYLGHQLVGPFPSPPPLPAVRPIRHSVRILPPSTVPSPARVELPLHVVGQECRIEVARQPAYSSISEAQARLDYGCRYYLRERRAHHEAAENYLRERRAHHEAAVADHFTDVTARTAATTTATTTATRTTTTSTASSGMVDKLPDSGSQICS